MDVLDEAELSVASFPSLPITPDIGRLPTAAPMRAKGLSKEDIVLSVLFVINEYETLASWRVICEERDYVTYIAHDGRAALDVLRREPIDVIVADRKTSGMSGCELCYHLRKDRRLAEAVFILVSDEPSPPAFLYYDAFLNKPLAPAQLTSEIDRITIERRANGRSKAARVAGLRF